MTDTLLRRIARGLKIVSFRVVRERGGLRATVALRGRPFARSAGAPRSVESRFKVLDGVKLNVGGGKGHPRVPGWLIVDLRDTADIRLDITRDVLPFEDDSVDVIFTSHTLEHIYPQHLDAVLREFHRILKPRESILRVLARDFVATHFDLRELASQELSLYLGGTAPFARSANGS